jgi:hypothetical protein
MARIAGGIHRHKVDILFAIDIGNPGIPSGVNDNLDIAVSVSVWDISYR